MKTRNNIEEIKYLIPDYIKGSLSDNEMNKVENAISSSTELKDFYEEVKSVLNVAASAKLDEPLQQYWNTLLPRIHTKIEQKKYSRNIFGNTDVWGYVWKVLLPAAAVIVVFVIFRITTMKDNTQLTKRDTLAVQQDNNLSQNNTHKENKPDIESSDNNEKLSVNAHNTVKEHRKTIERNFNYPENEEVVLNNNKEQKTDEIQNNEKEDLSSSNIDELEYFASADDNGLDEETEKQLDNLDNVHQKELLEQLSKTNL